MGTNLFLLGLSLVQLHLHIKIKFKCDDDTRSTYGLPQLGQMHNIFHYLTPIVGLLGVIRAIDPVPLWGTLSWTSVSFISAISTSIIFFYTGWAFFFIVDTGNRISRETTPSWMRTLTSLVMGGIIFVAFLTSFLRFATDNSFLVHGIFLLYLALTVVFMLVMFNMGYWKVRSHTASLQRSQSATLSSSDLNGTQTTKKDKLKRSMKKLWRAFILLHTVFIVVGLLELVVAMSTIGETEPTQSEVNEDAEQYTIEYTFFFWLQCIGLAIAIWYGYIPLKWLEFNPERPHVLTMRGDTRNRLRSESRSDLREREKERERSTGPKRGSGLNYKNTTSSQEDNLSQTDEFETNELASNKV